MSKPMIRIHNAETDEIIDREMTDAEFANYQKLQKELFDAQAKAEQAKINAEAKLASLGLTADDLKALGL